ncbi:MAG: ABC transporter permease [Chloroflexi bacterium]|nr:ABC transporter permease [Chloroflexota bacterium]
MIGFLFRTAIKSAFIQKYRFVSLAVTIAVASALLITLATLYLNAESQLALGLSGIPNMVLEPQKSVVATSRLTTDDVAALKSRKHFWRNNILNAAPVAFAEGQFDGKPVKVAGTWFDKQVSVDGESYNLGLLRFKGWEQKGGPIGGPVDRNAVVIGANVAAGDSVRLTVNGTQRVFPVARTLKTGSYWDDYVFLDLDNFRELTGKDALDQVLVGALIKPKDKLATRAELYGTEGFTEAEFQAWYCSPYASAIAYTIKETVPPAEVKVLRRVTEVQEGIIQASSGVFMALFVLTLITAVTAIFAGEKMYASAKMRELGIMAAIGASRQRLFLQLVTEVGLASLVAAAVAYLLSWGLVRSVSLSVFTIGFQANGILIAASALTPFLVSLVALLFLRKGLNKNVVEVLR